MNTTACFVVAFSIRSFCVIILNLLGSVAPQPCLCEGSCIESLIYCGIRVRGQPLFLKLTKCLLRHHIHNYHAIYSCNKKRSVQNTVLQRILRTHLLRRKDEAYVYIFFSSIHCIFLELPSLLRFDSFSSFCFSFSIGDSFGSMPTLRQYSS